MIEKMTKEQQYEELASIVEYPCDPRDADDCVNCEFVCDDKHGCAAHCAASDIQKLGYVKVSEDEMVITKKEYYKLKKYNRDRKRLRRKVVNMIEAKKEVVLEFANDLGNAHLDIPERLLGAFDTHIILNAVSKTMVKIGEEKYGVKIIPVLKEVKNGER